jgi:hypothetical protein
MTSFFTAAPGCCSRLGVAVLLVALADFLFYGEPPGITVFLFAILIAGAVVAVHPSAFSDGRLWLKCGTLFVALLPLAENVSPLSPVWSICRGRPATSWASASCWPS